MKMPNFLIIGAPKSGTTSLYYYARQHPQVFMSDVKEPNFFALENDPVDFNGPWDREWFRNFSVTSREDYERLFASADGFTAVGEASPMYLYHPAAPDRIHDYVPNVRLVAILRNPVERAYSAFLHKVREGREPCTDFAEALREEESRIASNWEGFWHYKSCGLYSRQLSRYYEHFARDQIRVYTFDDFAAQPQRIITDMFDFLGVDTAFRPDVRKSYNEAALPKSAFVNRLVSPERKLKHAIRPLIPASMRSKLSNRIRKLNSSHAIPPLRDEVRRELAAYYRPDVVALEEILGRDLSAWLN